MGSMVTPVNLGQSIPTTPIPQATPVNLGQNQPTAPLYPQGLQPVNLGQFQNNSSMQAYTPNGQLLPGSSTAPIIPQAQPGAAPVNTIPTQPASSATAAPAASPIPTASTPGNTGQLNDIYGATGGVISNLLGSETPGTANSLGQTIINANAPNVAQGSATLNEGLAMAGISPSSSVSAIENANYQSGVEQQNLSTLAQTNITEQQMQQDLLESLEGSAQQQQTDSSGWSIFGDVAQGLGDVAGLGTGFGTTVGGDLLGKLKD